MDDEEREQIREEIRRELEAQMREEVDNAAGNEVKRLTVKEMSVPFTVTHPWCIAPPANGNFELRGTLVHQLPKFRGMNNENPFKFLKEFLVVCDTMRTNDENEEALKLKAFPFALGDHAKHWLMSLPSRSIHSWDDLQGKFLDKFYPAAKISMLRRELAAPKQAAVESLYEYYERFRELEANCHNHGLPQHVLIENFLNGPLPMELRLLNACASGNIRNLYPNEVWELVAETADQVRYQNNLEEGRNGSRSVNKVDATTEEVKELRDLVYKFVSSQTITVPTCGFCKSTEHKTDACQNIDDYVEDVNAMGGWTNNRAPQGQKQFGLANNGFSWKDETSMRMIKYNNNNNNAHQPNQQNQLYLTPRQRRGDDQNNHQEAPQKRSLEEIVGQLAHTVKKSEERNDKRFGQLEAQITQMGTSINALKGPDGALPSQTIKNPKGEVNVITLRTGRTVGNAQEAEGSRQKTVEQAGGKRN